MLRTGCSAPFGSNSRSRAGALRCLGWVVLLLWIGAGHAQAEAHRVTVGERGVVADSNSKITFVEPPDARATIVKTDPAHWYIFFDARNASPSLAKITFTE
jgi:hypothetical protein